MSRVVSAATAAAGRFVPPQQRDGPGTGRRPTRLSSRCAALALALLPHVSSGCYTYAAMRGSPPVGTRVVLDVNDVGRVALGPRLGTALARIEGDLVRKTDTSYVVRMQQVRTLDGITTHWDGETVSLRDEYIVGVGEREFSRSRTVFATVGFLVAVGAIIAGQSLVGGGSGDERPGPGGGSGQNH